MSRYLLVGLVLIVTALPRLALAQTLVLVSLDGFRHDYLDRFEAPNLNAMAASGVRVRRLETIYPPNTFPGHLSLITGLPPEAHGIVDNHFCDDDRGDCYHMGGGRKDASWLKGVPLWNLAEAQGLPSATYFWPESDARWGGRQPSYFLPYQKRAPYSARVDQVIEWLSLPEAVRPRLVTLYFSAVDSAGHRYGTNSAELEAAVALVDYHIGRLWRGLQALDRSDLSVLIVSDHGMSDIRAEHAILADTLPEPPGFERMVSHARVRYFRKNPEDDPDEAAIAALGAELATRAQGRWQTLDQQGALAMGGVTSANAGVYTLVTRPPHFFARKSMAPGTVEGTHGYPLDVDDMAAFAVAVGPGFRSGVVIERAHQLDVYPVAAQLLGLATPVSLPSTGGALREALR